jgi:hypothetical protein
MAIARITGAGMAAVAVLVAILWSCILVEHLIVQRANRELAQAMTEIRLLQKKRVEPTSTPVPRHSAKPAIG